MRRCRCGRFVIGGVPQARGAACSSPMEVRAHTTVWCACRRVFSLGGSCCAEMPACTPLLATLAWQPMLGGPCTAHPVCLPTRPRIITQVQMDVKEANMVLKFMRRWCCFQVRRRPALLLRWRGLSPPKSVCRCRCFLLRTAGSGCAASLAAVVVGCAGVAMCAAVPPTALQHTLLGLPCLAMPALMHSPHPQCRDCRACFALPCPQPCCHGNSKLLPCPALPTAVLRLLRPTLRPGADAEEASGAVSGSLPFRNSADAVHGGVKHVQRAAAALLHWWAAACLQRYSMC